MLLLQDQDDYILEKDIECIVERANMLQSSSTTVLDEQADASAAAAPPDLYTERDWPKSSYVEVSILQCACFLSPSIEISVCAAAPGSPSVASLTLAAEAEHQVSTATH